MSRKTAFNIIDGVPDTVMAIGAHPDDVELGAGGTLARWSQLGAVVTVVVCTDGGAGSPHPGMAPKAVTECRRKEQKAAADDLGVRHLVMLGNADGGLQDSNDFRGALVELVREHRPEVVLTHDPHARNRFIHRDHRITGQVALDAIYPYARDPLHYPHQITAGLCVHRVDRCLLWDSDNPNAIIDIAATLETKGQALGRHASQLNGIVGDTNPVAWLRQRGREAAAGSGFSSGEAFRLLEAPP